MNAKDLAALLNGREYGEEITREEAQIAKGAGLVVVYGTSDDLLEFDGAIYDEAGAPGLVLVDNKGLLPSFESASEDEEAMASYIERKKTARQIEAVWCEDGSGYAWILKTDIPHETFSIMEDGEGFSRGIVFALADLVPVPADSDDGPGEEDGPWAPGWEDRTGETRKKFEAWIKSVPFFAHCSGEVIERDDMDGGYVDSAVHGAWLAWNARGAK